MREPLAAMWRALEDVTLRNLSPQQAEELMTAAYSVVEAINDRTHVPDPVRTVEGPSSSPAA